jgi:hypothetical protein
VKVQTACSERLREAVRSGARSLSEEAAQGVREFILGQINPDGGFRGRSQASDLYYTVFGLECAEALDLQWPGEPLRNYVLNRVPERADFVHLACLARCLEHVRKDLDGSLWSGAFEDVRTRLKCHACPEGGYHQQPNSRGGTIYESFLGLLAGEALGMPFPQPDRMHDRLKLLRRSSGGFVNDTGFGTATTPVTAAAVCLHAELDPPAPTEALHWLRARLSANGGFKAAQLVPVADLLSTATALHALGIHGWTRELDRHACFEFVTSLWNNDGGFGGHAFDGKSDCEYVFYALLALGTLRG